MAVPQQHIALVSTDCPTIVLRVLSQRGCWKTLEDTSENLAVNNAVLHWKLKRFLPLDMEFAEKLSPTRKVNHFEHSHLITRKDSLHRQLSRLRTVYGQQLFWFCPLTFGLPHERAKFESFCTSQQNSAALWICKPARLSQGREIYLLKGPDELKKFDTLHVVQQYPCFIRISISYSLKLHRKPTFSRRF